MGELALKKGQDIWWKVSTLLLTTAITLAIHYGWLLEPLFGHVGWVHAIHGRLCYIPIVIAASWFGIRGGLWTSVAISILVLPYIFYFGREHIEISAELLEIVFYLAIAVLTGGLVDRETAIRRRHEQAQVHLERSHKLSMIGQMAAGVAHEIKNPLASIKGAFEILCDNSTTPVEKREFEEIVFKEIKRIDGTVKEFLEFARPREFKPKKINLSDILRSALKQLGNLIDKAGLRLLSEISDDIYVRADQQKIHQVIINLILNAIEASEPQDIVKVSLSADNSQAQLIFEDSGKGINETDLGKIFEPFYTTKSKGTGLGLAVVKSIIDRHNGSIRVESIQSKGTKFKLSLPIYKDG